MLDPAIECAWLPLGKDVEAVIWRRGSYDRKSVTEPATGDVADPFEQRRLFDLPPVEANGADRVREIAQ